MPPRSARAMSSTPSPRPAVAPSAGMGVQSSLPVARILISPSNRFGSGSASVASVPVISTNPCRRSGESKLSSSDAAWPAANRTRAATWVGTCTPNAVPARGPAPMTLVARLRWPRAATCVAGPNSRASVAR